MLLPWLARTAQGSQDYKRHVVRVCERAAASGAHAMATSDTAHALVGSVNRDEEP
jgi:hypothetical protein